mgnify:CR=1 FL=1
MNQAQQKNKMEEIKNFLKDLGLPIDVEGEYENLIIETHVKYVVSAIYNHGETHLMVRDGDGENYETVLISLGDDGVHVYPMSKPSRTSKKEFCSKYPDVCSKYEEKHLPARLRPVEMTYNGSIIRVVAEVGN